MIFSHGIRRNEEILEEIRRHLLGEAFRATGAAALSGIQSGLEAVRKEALTSVAQEGNVALGQETAANGGFGEASRLASFYRAAPREHRERIVEEMSIERWYELLEQEERRHCQQFMIGG